MVEKCPGQDSRYWKKEHAYEAPCPRCGRPVEFFRDDMSRKCPACGVRFKNPKLDLSCLKWCPYAEECISRAEEFDEKGIARKGRTE